MNLSQKISKLQITDLAFMNKIPVFAVNPVLPFQMGSLMTVKKRMINLMKPRMNIIKDIIINDQMITTFTINAIRSTAETCLEKAMDQMGVSLDNDDDALVEYLKDEIYSLAIAIANNLIKNPEFKKNTTLLLKTLIYIGNKSMRNMYINKLGSVMTHLFEDVNEDANHEDFQIDTMYINKLLNQNNSEFFLNLEILNTLKFEEDFDVINLKEIPINDPTKDSKESQILRYIRLKKQLILTYSEMLFITLSNTIPDLIIELLRKNFFFPEVIVINYDNDNKQTQMLKQLKLNAKAKVKGKQILTKDMLVKIIDDTDKNNFPDHLMKLFFINQHQGIITQYANCFIEAFEYTFGHLEGTAASDFDIKGFNTEQILELKKVLAIFRVSTYDVFPYEAVMKDVTIFNEARRRLVLV